MNQPVAHHNAPKALTGLPKRLVDQGYIAERDVASIIAKSKIDKRGFLETLIEEGLVDDVAAAHIAAQEFGLPLLRLNALNRDCIPVELNNAELNTQLRAVIIHDDDSRLSVAISDPLNFAALDEIKTRLQRAVRPVLVCHSELRELIRSISAASAEQNPQTFSEFFEQNEVDREEAEVVVLEVQDDDPPAVQFVAKLLLDTINRGASDIHIEPYESHLRARLRFDGVLQEVAKAPKNMSEKICARIKVLANLDVAEKRIPQDGRIRVAVSQTKKIDFRVNTCPTLFGEKIVMRQLDSSSAMLGIEMLGYEDAQRELYESALSKPYGMILVTGPTGSGKTVSLYTGLSILNTEYRNISTAEDPAEINLPGINQVNVNHKIGLDFASALRAFLRQDPDVIMVGEIRDLDTANIAIKAAQTGHLVLSTLHTNDAPQTLTRLADMGVPPYSIATSVSLIIAQRLARRLCTRCAAPEDVPREILLQEGFTEADLNDATLLKAVGCDDCNNGYRGRTGIYQVMPVSEEIQRTILRNGTARDIEACAKTEGVDDLRRSAIRKVCAGITSLEEINRVTKD